jgi:hypothetical protein
VIHPDPRFLAHLFDRQAAILARRPEQRTGSETGPVVGDVCRTSPFRICFRIPSAAAV